MEMAASDPKDHSPRPPPKPGKVPPPPPPSGDVSQKWQRHCELNWKDAVSATLLFRSSNHQKNVKRIQDYTVRSSVDDAGLEPEHSPVSLVSKVDEDRQRHLESGPLAGYYGLQLWGWRNGEHVDLGCVWEYKDLSTSASGGDQHLALVGILRGALIESHRDYHDLSAHNASIQEAAGSFMKEALATLAEIPKMIRELGAEIRTATEQTRQGGVDFFEARTKEQQWSQFWTTLRWLTASAGAFYIARKEQDAGRPGNFDPEKIKAYADAMHDPTEHARQIARDLAIKPEQRETFVALLGEDVVAEVDEICRLADQPSVDVGAILVRIKGLLERVDPMKLATLIPHLDEKQFAAFSAVQKLINQAKASGAKPPG